MRDAIIGAQVEQIRKERLARIADDPRLRKLDCGKRSRLAAQRRFLKAICRGAPTIRDAIRTARLADHAFDSWARRGSEFFGLASIVLRRNLPRERSATIESALLHYALRPRLRTICDIDDDRSDLGPPGRGEANA